jgi:hypothetical protein
VEEQQMGLATDAIDSHLQQKRVDTDYELPFLQIQRLDHRRAKIFICAP